MRKCIYVVANLHLAKQFIKVNTPWQRMSNLNYFYKSEQITVVTSFSALEGIRPDKVYIDHTFRDLPSIESHSILGRLKELGMEPVMITEETYEEEA